MRHFLIIVFTCFFLSGLWAEDTIKILTIGNSFSEDAVENYLYDLGKNKGITFVIGNLYIGSSSLETHWKNAQNNSAAYSYRKIVATGVKTSTANTTLLEAIKDEQWNYISFQQNSGNSGLITSYFPFLSDLLNYVKTNATNPSVNYIFHQTWAYAANATHSAFVNYGKDQMTMYNAIISTVNQATNQAGIDLIVPSGTAIQNGRTSILGDTFNRDGYHLNLGMGRFTAACTWYEKLTGLPVQENSFIPASVTESESEIVKKAAHFAVLYPDSITSLEIEMPEPITLTSPVKIDFGGIMSTSEQWNSFVSFSNGSLLYNLKDSIGNETGLIMTVNAAFAGVNTAGASSSNTSLNMPLEVSQDCFWSEALGTFTSVARPKSGFKIANLDPNESYKLSFFGSRMSTTDNRETLYKVIGSTQDSVALDASDNSKNTVAISGIHPSDDGEVMIVVKAGANNNNQHKFYYINALQIERESVTALAQLESSASTVIYPNPFSAGVHITSAREMNQINLYNHLGQLYLSANLPATNDHELQLDYLPLGSYVLGIKDTNGKQSTFAIIKK